jgi:hypothetical protein
MLGFVGMTDDFTDRFAPLLNRLDKALMRQALSSHHSCACGDAGVTNAVNSATARLVEEVRALCGDADLYGVGWGPREQAQRPGPIPF